jgi:hypothetical protein
MAALRALLLRVPGPLRSPARCPALRPFASGECGPWKGSFTPPDWPGLETCPDPSSDTEPPACTPHLIRNLPA